MSRHHALTPSADRGKQFLREAAVSYEKIDGGETSIREQH